MVCASCILFSWHVGCLSGLFNQRTSTEISEESPRSSLRSLLLHFAAEQFRFIMQTHSHGNSVCFKPMYLYWFVLNKSMCDSLLILGDQASSNMPLSPTSKSPGSFPFRKQKKIPAALKEVMIQRTATVFHMPIKADLIWPNVIKTVSSSQCVEVCLAPAIHNCLEPPLAS